MSGKIIISIVSLILIVGVAIGVVVTVHKKGEDPEIQTQQRSLRVICKNSEDQKLCYETLGSVRGADAADPKAYLAAAVKAATDNVIKAFNMTDRLRVEYGDKDRGIKMALDGCKEMMEFALDSLDLSNTLVRDNNIQSVHVQNPDLRTWLSAVISYKQACMEGFDDKIEVEKKIKDELHTQTIDRVTKVTVVALEIVSDLSNILQEFGLKLVVKPSSRRLLSEEIDNEKGFPTWVSATDRKLLAKMEGSDWKLNFKPNVVVAKDGTGQFKTIMEAIHSYPNGTKGGYIIYVKAGIYNENVTIEKNCRNLFMYGDGPEKTIITGRANGGINKTKTMYTASFTNKAMGFMAKAMGFENTAGTAGHQAVAFRNQGDQSAFFDCHFLGYQDTLYVQSNRQFYRNCAIYGTIDFIFGTSNTLIQHSVIRVRKPEPKQKNTIIADGTEKPVMFTGIVIQDCQILADKELEPVKGDINFETYLGRPWKNYSRMVFMESDLGDFINQAGWIPWQEQINTTINGQNKTINIDVNMDLCYIAEFKNTGDHADVSKRIKWKGYQGEIIPDVARNFTASVLLKVNETSAETWLHEHRLPHYLGFRSENKLPM